MLKNLFNNPWFIGALGVFASLYLGWSIAKPIFFDESEETFVMGGNEDGSFVLDDGTDGVFDDGDEYADENYDDTDVDPYDYDDPEANEAIALDVVDRDEAIRDRAHIGWLDDVERDPFANSPLAEKSVSVSQLPSVEALFLSNGVQAAVIDSRLVQVGDKVAQFEVTEIGENYVQLSHAGKRFRLEPKAG